MARVDVTVAGRTHRLACEDGEEARVAQLAGHVDAEMRRLTATVGPQPEATMILMAALMLADRLGEATEALREAERALSAAATGAAPAAAEASAAHDATARPQPGLFDEDEAIAAIHGAVRRLEEIVALREDGASEAGTS